MWRSGVSCASEHHLPAVTSIQTLLRWNRLADAFCDLVKKTTGSIGDKNLRQVLAETASLKIFELMERDLFSEKKIANVWAADVLKESTKQFKTTAAKNQQLLDEIMAGKKEINSLKENLKELVDVLSTTHTCFNRECKPRFGFNIQQPLQNVEKRWLILCPLCGRRYTYDKEKKSTVVLPPSPRTTN